MDSTKHYKIIFKAYGEIKGGYIEYTINLSCENDTEINFDFKDRFSNLNDLHTAFKKEANSINFPKFPPKKLWGNKEEKFLLERRIKLQHYFNTILGSKDFSKLISLTKWIDELLSLYYKPNKNKSSDKLADLSENNNDALNQGPNTANSKPIPSTPKSHNGN